jgi:polar amino acid transport system substrate-binding protein
MRGIQWMLGCVFAGVLCAEDAGSPVRFCNDDTEWPPYFFYQRKENTINKDVVEGATLDLLTQLFKQVGLSYTFDLVPWKRCQQEVSDYTTNNGYFEATSDATYNAERGQHYYYTAPIYFGHQGVFYSKKHFATGVPNIQKTSDLNAYTLCGQNGFNYSMFKTAGLTAEIDMSSADVNTAMEKLRRERCDFFVATVEPVYGAQWVGHLALSEDIQSIILKDIPETPFHLLISKKSPRAYELVAKLNQAIFELQHSGASEGIFNTYFKNRRTP